MTIRQRLARLFVARSIGHPALVGALVVAFAASLTACADAQAGLAPSASTAPPSSATALPHFDHIVVVIEENHSYDDIMGSDQAPSIHALAQQGALFTNSHAVAHPSQPNYLALFAGSTFGLTSDACPQQYTGPNVGAAALSHGLRFVGYSESMPKIGYTGCSAGDPLDPAYARKHNPWADFSNIPSASNQPFSAFPQDDTRLPALAFVVPNEQHDMHSGSVADGDTWLQQHIDPFARWAQSHNSLLVVTWDEDDGSVSNHIATIFVGAHVKPGHYDEAITHYDVLRTLEALDGLAFVGNSASAKTIADVWQA